jgi:hypothetical protein
MDDANLVTFLQWALPRLRLRWPGYRKVRGTVRQRLNRRLRDLELPDLAAYQDYPSSRLAAVVRMLENRAKFCLCAPSTRTSPWP